MNKRNEWRSLLAFVNKELKKYAKKIVVTKTDGTFSLEIHHRGSGLVENYAEGYFEDELSDLINDAWHYALIS